MSDTLQETTEAPDYESWDQITVEEILDDPLGVQSRVFRLPAPRRSRALLVSGLLYTACERLRYLEKAERARQQAEEEETLADRASESIEEIREAIATLDAQ